MTSHSRVKIAIIGAGPVNNYLFYVFFFVHFILSTPLQIIALHINIIQVGSLCACFMAEHGYDVTVYENRTGKIFF